MKRRTLLVGGSSVLALGALGAVAPCAIRGDLFAVRETLDVLENDIPALRTAGAVYQNGSAAFGALDRLLARSDITNAMSLSCPASRRMALLTCVKESFANDPVVIDDGWVRSAVERDIALILTA